MNIARRKLFIKILSVVMLFLFAGIGFFSLQPKTYIANADSFVEEVRKDSKFSMAMTAKARKQTTLPLDKRTITNTVGEELDYFCFTWRDLELFRFNFSAEIKNSTTQYTHFKFLLTNIQTDDLQTALGVIEPDILYQSNIASNGFSQFYFDYYIDSASSVTETATRRKGKDFGLYKFDFVYTYLDDGVEIDVSVGDICVAVIPDDIDKVPQTDVRILYSVSSSNKLMNVFNLYLSNDSYKYVNPKYLQWNVVGQDQMNANYVLTEKAKQDDVNYANYRVIWPSLANTTGTSFIFDSNNIEGTWNAYCTIKNSTGEEKLTLSIQNLSTIKKEKPSYIWLILTIIIVVLAIFAVIALIVFKKKNDKVW